MTAQWSTAGGCWRVVSSNSWPTNITLYSGTNRHCHKCCHCAEAPPRPPGNTAVSWLVVCPDFNRVKNKSYSSLVTGLFWLHSEKIYWKKIYRCETPASTLAAAATVCSGLPGRPPPGVPRLSPKPYFSPPLDGSLPRHDCFCEEIEFLLSFTWVTSIPATYQL